MTSINFDFIASTIADERCAILLGPDIVSSNDKDLLQKQFLDFIDFKNNPNISNYIPNDGLFTFPGGQARTRIAFEVKKFYKQIQQSDFFEKLIQIPFHLHLSTRPDNILGECFSKQNLQHQFHYYQYSKNPVEIEKATKDYPLIYNLFGSIDDYDSLVLSHTDLYNFLFAILGKHKLPQNLQTALGNIDNFIFLGFQFDKWYAQIISRLLKLDLKDFDRYAISGELSQEVIQFYKDQFKITFVVENTTQFLDNLYAECNKLGILRSFEQDQRKISDQVEEFAQNQQIEKALEKLKHFFKDNDEDLYDDTVLLTGRYKRLQKKIDKGIITQEDEELEQNKIFDAILNMNKELKELEN